MEVHPLLAPLLSTLPWVLAGFYLALGIRFPRPLPPPPTVHPERRPRVSVIIPARNEESNVGRCVESLTLQRYPDFQILVVDDRSEDGTARVVRAVPPGNAAEVRVLPGEPLPEGWFGKPWACRQGAAAADGDLLLFTDADTFHAPDLLNRVVAALGEDDVQAVSLVGRQEMGSFWERLIQPQIFTLLGIRYPDLRRPLGRERWKEAAANGQYILVTRAAYEAMGGHTTVRGEVVEDIRLAQELARAGFRISIRGAEDAFATRMYRSLRELVAGWTKNISVGARQTAPGGLASLAIPGVLVYLLGFWVLPPVALAAALVGEIGGIGFLLWAGLATACGVAIWTAASVRMGAPAVYGLIYPLGAAMTAFIVVRSGLRGAKRIEWKGRRYGEGRGGTR